MPIDLEQLLRQMPVRRPGPGLDRRVQALLARHQERPAGWRRWVTGRSPAWLAAAAVVAIATVLAWRLARPGPVSEPPPPTVVQTPRATPAEDRPQRLRYEQVDYHLVDDGLVSVTERGPVRQYRQQALQRVLWYDAGSATRYVLAVPYEQTFYVREDVN